MAGASIRSIPWPVARGKVRCLSRQERLEIITASQRNVASSSMCLNGRSPVSIMGPLKAPQELTKTALVNVTKAEHMVVACIKGAQDGHPFWFLRRHPNTV